MADTPTRDLSPGGPAWAIQDVPPSVVSSKVAGGLRKVQELASEQATEPLTPRMAQM